MSKVAKLVWVSVGTRVIVDENASEEKIINIARDVFFEEGGNFEDFVERTEDDIENPYDPMKDFENYEDEYEEEDEEDDEEDDDEYYEE